MLNLLSQKNMLKKKECELESVKEGMERTFGEEHNKLVFTLNSLTLTSINIR